MGFRATIWRLSDTAGHPAECMVSERDDSWDVIVRHGRAVLVATASVQANQQAIEISGPASVVVLMGLAGPDDAISLPLLSNLYLDKTIRFSLLYPLQWPTAIKILAGKTVDTSKIITHSASLDGIAPAIERVLNRDDEVIKTVIKP